MSDLETLRIFELMTNARARSASDLHFGGMHRPALRIDGRLIVLDESDIENDAVRSFLQTSLPKHVLARLDVHGTTDGTLLDVPIGPHRVHAYRQVGGVRVVVRFLSRSVPTLESLQLPAVLATFAARPSGLILFTGPTGSGKTTALAGMIDRINRTLERSIVTIEDPIEYLHAPIRSIVTQCEIGRDVESYQEALRGVVRADPNVIFVGEMRDNETMKAAMSAAETGHLVFATLHTNDASQTIDRIVDSFPSDAHGQVRSQLAQVLHAVVSLRLVSRKHDTGRRAVAEVLVVTDAVRNLIREAKTHQIRNAIVTGRNAGMQTLETHLSELLVRDEIDALQARAVSVYPADIRGLERAAG